MDINEYKRHKKIVAPIIANKSILGIYDNSNFPKINMKGNHRYGAEHTEAHEHVHYILTNGSVGGVLESLVDKLGEHVDQFESIHKEVYKSMQKTQESVATFVEICSKLGSNVPYNRIEDDLRRNAYDYYKYVKPLLFLFKEDQDFISIQDKAQYVLEMGLYALSARLVDIPKETFIKPNKLRRFLTSSENIQTFRTDSRFKILYKTLEKHIRDKKELPSIDALVEMCELSYEMPSERYVDEIKKYILSLDIITESKKEAISQTLNRLVVKQKDDTLSHIHPTLLSSINGKKMDVIDLKEVVGSNLGVLTFWGVLMEEPQLPAERLKYIVAFFDLKSKEAYTCIATHSEAQELVNIMLKSSTLLVMSKFFDKVSIISGLKIPPDRKVFVYNDYPILTQTEKINSILGKDPKVCFVGYDNFNLQIILIDINKKIYFIQPYSNRLHDEIFNIVKGGKSKYKLDVKVDGYDNYVIKDQEDMIELDIFINAFLQS